jgi:hypothetical protein
MMRERRTRCPTGNIAGRLLTPSNADRRLDVEERVFEAERFVETHLALGESFDLVF